MFILWCTGGNSSLPCKRLLDLVMHKGRALRRTCQLSSICFSIYIPALPAFHEEEAEPLRVDPQKVAHEDQTGDWKPGHSSPAQGLCAHGPTSVQGSRRTQSPPISPQPTLPLRIFDMVGTTLMISPQWCESDSHAVPRQTELIESMSRQCWLKDTVFCCHRCYSFLNGLLETVSLIEKLQVQCKHFSFS